jgi:hypothetical protein
MKQVTAAYADKNLTELLRLEREWVRNASLQVDRLSDDTVKIYISALEDQIAGLKEEHAGLVLQARYAPVARLSFYPEVFALKAIQDEASGIRNAVHELKDFRNVLASGLPPGEIMKHMKEYMSTHPMDEQPAD